MAEATPSADGATKLLLELDDGARIEAVHMPRAVRRPRVTLCVSSQVGCAMGCTFCATGAMGLARQLATHEIVGQVVAVMSALGPPRPDALTLVFMGMGEPLHNADAVARALRVLCHPAGLGLAPSRITVSTAGYVPGIDCLAREEVRPLLSVSLNATTDEARARTMPITRAFGMDALREALLRWPLRPHEKLTVSYVLLAGENDSDDDADSSRRVGGVARRGGAGDGEPHPDERARPRALSRAAGGAPAGVRAAPPGWRVPGHRAALARPRRARSLRRARHRAQEARSPLLEDVEDGTPE